MKKKKLLAGLVALTLLAGCAKTPPADKPSADHENDLTYQTIGIPRDTTMVTVDGSPVSAEVCLFWMTRAVSSWVSSYGLDLEEDWAQPYGEGSSISINDTVKADALSVIKHFQLLENKAREYGVTLNAGQEEAMAADMAQAIQQAGGEEAFQTMLDQLCISREAFENQNRIAYLQEALWDRLRTEGKLGEDTLDEFIQENQIYGAKHILISTRRINADGTGYEELSDEEKAQAKAKADDLRSQLTAAGDSAKLFDELMNEYSEDGRDSNGNLGYPEGYTYVYSQATATSYAQTVMVTEFEEGAKALEIGEISQPVKSDYGYHIIMRIDVDRDQAASDMLNDLTWDWMEAAKVETTPAYEELKVKDFFLKLQDVLAEKYPAESQEPSTEPTASPAN